MSTVETQLILAPETSEPLQPVLLATLRPREGVMMRLEPRHG